MAVITTDERTEWMDEWLHRYQTDNSVSLPASGLDKNNDSGYLTVELFN